MSAFVKLQGLGIAQGAGQTLVVRKQKNKVLALGTLSHLRQSDAMSFKRSADASFLARKPSPTQWPKRVRSAAIASE
jgi:hypothetical protein